VGVHEAFLDVAKKEVCQMIVRQLFTLFNDWNAKNRAARTAEFYVGQLSRVVDLLGELEADELRPTHLLPFRQTWHLVLSIQRLYRWAVEHDLAKSNAILKLKRPRLGKRRRVLSKSDILRLLRKASPDFRRLMLAARESAARPLELRELDWVSLHIPEGMLAPDALRLGQAFFLLIDFKSREQRTHDTAQRLIPISPRLGRLLCRLAGRQGMEGEIFRTARGRAWSYSALRCRMRRLRLRAGLPLSVRGEKICAYTLRHSAATQWIADGVNAYVVKELLGHARITTTQRYVHLNSSQLIAEWLRRKQRGGP
jgi:site-specific recombinase XerD